MRYLLCPVAAAYLLSIFSSLAAAANQPCCTEPSCAEPSCQLAEPVSLMPATCACNPCAAASCCAEPACSDPCCCPDCCCAPFWYGSFNLRGTVDGVRTSGFDSPPPVQGEGNEENDPLGIGGAIGFSLPHGDRRIRVEAEGMYLSSFHIDTNNVLAPFPPVFYSRYIGRWAVLGNIWYDIPLNDKLDFYFGGGVGCGGADIEVIDVQSRGRANVSDVIWQVGCGGVRHYEKFSLDVGYRFMDFGTNEVGLFDVNGVQTGSFRTDLVSHQLFIGFRFNSLFRMFAR